MKVLPDFWKQKIYKTYKNLKVDFILKSFYLQEEKIIFKLLYNGYSLSINDIHRIVYNDKKLIKFGKAISNNDIKYVVKVTILILETNLDNLIIQGLIKYDNNKYILHEDVFSFKRKYMLKRIACI